jgi:hypothetical protein
LGKVFKLLKRELFNREWICKKHVRFDFCTFMHEKDRYFRSLSNSFDNAGVVCPRTSNFWMLGSKKQVYDWRWEIDLIRMSIVNLFLWWLDLTPKDIAGWEWLCDLCFDLGRIVIVRWCWFVGNFLGIQSLFSCLSLLKWLGRIDLELVTTGEPLPKEDVECV